MKTAFKIIIIAIVSILLGTIEGYCLIEYTKIETIYALFFSALSWAITTFVLYLYTIDWIMEDVE